MYKVKPGRCMCGCGKSAQSRAESVLQLTAECASARYPGSDSIAYAALVEWAGYDRSERAQRMPAGQSRPDLYAPVTGPLGDALTFKIG